MGRPKDPPTLLDLGLSQDIVDKIHDLQEGFIGAPEARVIAHAINFYLEHGIESEPAVKDRYLKEQATRIAAKK
jgi:hypothetical protein